MKQRSLFTMTDNMTDDITADMSSKENDIAHDKVADNEQRYLVRQRKINPTEKDVAVYAKAMLGKNGEFEGVSFIRNKDKASVMTLALAQRALDWTTTKKARANEYATTIICLGQ